MILDVHVILFCFYIVKKYCTVRFIQFDFLCILQDLGVKRLSATLFITAKSTAVHAFWNCLILLSVSGLIKISLT